MRSVRIEREEEGGGRREEGGSGGRCGVVWAELKICPSPGDLGTAY